VRTPVYKEKNPYCNAEWGCKAIVIEISPENGNLRGGERKALSKQEVKVFLEGP